MLLMNNGGWSNGFGSIINCLILYAMQFYLKEDLK